MLLSPTVLNSIHVKKYIIKLPAVIPLHLSGHFYLLNRSIECLRRNFIAAKTNFKKKGQCWLFGGSERIIYFEEKIMLTSCFYFGVIGLVKPRKSFRVSLSFSFSSLSLLSLPLSRDALSSLGNRVNRIFQGLLRFFVRTSRRSDTTQPLFLFF